MDRNEVLEKVIEVCKDIFDKEDLELTGRSCAADIEEWDSLTHLSMISDLEDEFEIRFTLDEINGGKNLGELVNVIMKHKEKQGEIS